MIQHHLTADGETYVSDQGSSEGGPFLELLCGNCIKLPGMTQFPSIIPEGPSASMKNRCTMVDCTGFRAIIGVLVPGDPDIPLFPEG